MTDSGKKKSFLLSQCGKETYSVLRSLVSPGKVSDKSYAQIVVELLNGHLKRTTSVIAARYRFTTCCRKEGQSIAE